MREEQLLDYIDGSLPAPERAELEKRLAEDADLRQLLEDLRAVQRNLSQLPEKQPSPMSEARFRAFLADEKNAAKPLSPPRKRGLLVSLFSTDSGAWLAAAASVLMLIGAGLGWLWQNNRRQQVEIAALRSEMRQTQQMLVLAMLEKPSASERIQAVNVLQKSQADPRIIAALIHTMNFDDMTNVRMKAARALANFGDDPTVKNALLEALRSQRSPDVQIALIEILILLGEQRAVQTFQDMLRDKALMDIVRKKAASGIEALL